MSEAADIRENRDAIGKLREAVAVNTKQLENGPGFQAALTALKEQIDTTRAGPRLVGLEGEVGELQAAVMAQGHHVKALTGSFDAFADELKAERLAKSVADAKKVAAAEAEAVQVRKDAADFRKRLQALLTSPTGLALLFALMSALGMWKSDTDKQEALALVRASISHQSAPAVDQPAEKSDD